MGQEDRRAFLAAAAGFPLLALRGEPSGQPHVPDPNVRGGPKAAKRLIRPAGLKPGDRVGLVNPATAAFDTISIDIAQDALRSLGLVPVLSEHYFDRRGYFAGTDEHRAADIMRFVLDPEIKGIWARGGWGSARVLPHLDYEAIAANPKVIVGYSDSTALLSGIHHRTGLVVFHGPFPKSVFTADHQRALLMEGAAPLLSNPTKIKSDETVQTEDRTRTLRGGKARGRLLGGNATVLTAIVGTPYLPDFDGAILFLEDVDEAVYRIDRMMTQLALSGVLSKLRGFIFGRCTDCPPGNGHGSLTLEEVLMDHVGPLGIPAFRGTMLGHIDDQFTVPIGAEIEMDADAATIRIMEPAVSWA
ncbi:putative murein peptide carboxypeptidase [Planctomycetes bacterium Poly30]|uniref:Putative murein peptide carboxypeptidase n=1 Tax=Saltatorellus ferox TaxID=2528018 RepID=A0A518ERG6_9BACT|nr:putative murein peptide carboxypeptidase [Planctomycetes bacterium Poly30]